MKDLSILENVIIVCFCRMNNRLNAREEARKILKVLELSKFPDEVTVVIQKRIELAMVLATKPPFNDA